MIDIEKYEGRFETALQQKKESKFREKILEELSKPEWNERKMELDKSLSSIKEEKDFDKYQKELAKLFDDIFEIITAPGVDAFIIWLNDLTDKKNETNTKKLRKLFVEDYTSYSDSIDSALDNKSELDFDDNSLFSSLLKEYEKGLKDICNKFLSKPDEFEHEVDGFIQNLNDNLSGLSEIKELSYGNIEELYTESQKNNNIDFYAEIIKKIVEENQSLKPINDSEKEDSILDKIKTRIEDIKKCIASLDKTGIANLNDDTVKDMFISFKDDMIKYEKGISQNLNEFLTPKWETIQSHYDIIKDFYNAKRIVEEDNWKSFKAKDAIAVLILKYNPLLDENPLTNLQHKSLLAIQQALTTKYNKIVDFNQEAEKTKKAILDAFRNTAKEYSDKLELIKKLDANDDYFSKIKDGIDGLNSGCDQFEKQDIITYLNNDFSSDLNTYDDIKRWFSEVLKKSEMTEQYEWLDKKLNGTDSGEILAGDFDTDVLKKLLSEGLIKLKIEKTF